MCGICGFFGKKKNKREIVEKMKEKLVHRGPDAQGSFVNDSVALGFRRLSIIDLEGGLQPMKSSSQNLTVVFNGEIYNYQELREQMEREKKILFVTRSDTETLVNGLEAYGSAFVEQLRGMFAFAVWNEKKEELMLARDFFGIKPLFYTVVDGNFVFASEIKSILQFPGVPKKLNERALEQYLSFQYSVLEETFFEGIYRLPPGCMLFYRQGKYEICRYFQPKLQPEAGCSLVDMEKKLESVLKKSVRRHMVSDVEVGTFLSGGVDSGFIAVSSGAKMAFTVGFLDGNSGYNEENRAREVARKYIPEDTAARKKLGFPVPVRVWLRDDDWYGRVKKMFQSPISRQYFHTEKLTALLEEHHAGKKDNSRKIWTVLAFLFWYQEYFDE